MNGGIVELVYSARACCSDFYLCSYALMASGKYIKISAAYMLLLLPTVPTFWLVPLVPANACHVRTSISYTFLPSSRVNRSVCT